MAHDQTTLDTRTTGSRVAAGGPDHFALVVLWSAEGPERVGEVGLLLGKGPWIVGRGEGAGHIPWLRQRPGRTEPRAPLGSPSLSRDQLELSASGDTLTVVNRGRRALSWNGEPVAQATLKPGDTLVVAVELVLMVTRRPAVLPGELHSEHRFGTPDAQGLVGESPACWQLRQQLHFAAGRPGHVLVHGRSGTGKELSARALHALSPRAKKPMVSRNAATLPEGIVDAELFGNQRNYPNPGMPERVGMVAEAHQGSLFLDEIGELPQAVQAHLLRVMDAGEYTRLGESRARRADVRLLCATNRPLSALKHDLLARLELRVEVPPLPERLEDVPLLANVLLDQLATEDPWIRERFFEGRFPRLAPELVDQLVRHVYEHDARELRRLLMQAMAASPGGVIEATRTVERAETVDELSPERIRAVLARNGGNRGATWRELGLRNRDQLYRLMKAHGIE